MPSLTKQDLTLLIKMMGRIKATHISFGRLSRTQQILGIGYLYVESQLGE
jgi:hypothetical protein